MATRVTDVAAGSLRGEDVDPAAVRAPEGAVGAATTRDTVDPMWGKVYRHTLRLNDDGTVSPPDVPGIGAEPNYEELERYRIA
jgi:L-alanine-DL-glutamate epimerase-like enolase superfamily enzyme